MTSEFRCTPQKENKWISSFYLFSLHVGQWGKIQSNILYNDRFTKFSQLIFRVSLPGTIAFNYKFYQVFTDDAQKNYLR